MQIGSRRCALALAFTGLLACDDGGGGGAGASGVDSQKLLVDLVDADVQRLCVFERDLYKAGLPDEEAYCTYFAFDESTGSCADEVDSCIDTEDYEQERDDSWSCDETTVEDYLDGLKPGCQLAVAEVEACIRASNKQRVDAMNAAVCDGMQSAAEEAELEAPAACARLDNCFED